MELRNGHLGMLMSDGQRLMAQLLDLCLLRGAGVVCKAMVEVAELQPMDVVGMTQRRKDGEVVQRWS